MTKQKSTKRALLHSALSLLMCISMLIGSTFAWFTDSVTSDNNIIKSGNLDVTLEYWNGTEWKDVEKASDILDGDLWEPGYVDVAYLRLKNTGSLALKYALGVNIISETPGVNKDGKEFKLSDYIYFDVAEDVNGEKAAYATREAAMDVATETTKISSGYTKRGSLEANTDKYVYLAMVVYMPATVGNDANHNGANVPEIDLGINVFATQYTSEEDSFDENYDADTAVFTVEEANAMMADGKDATLVNCIDYNGILNVPENYGGTLTVVNSTIKSIQGAKDVELVIVGNVTVDAKSGMARTAFDGSSITANGKLEISGNGHLTVIAADMAGAFGIGGMKTESINIEDITVDYAEGSYAYGVGADTKYYKDAPEGGAAIGSGFDGAEITLENVTVNKAIGGSKAAGIGARYHTGVTVNISNSNVAYVEGGVSAAGIGASRVSKGVAESGTTINITNSTINALGGAYGAGIGSGYDTHCQSKQPMCAINIENSTITAKGGKYAAGVGTGYHNAALAGEIKNSTVNAVSGEKFYKDAYTQAQDIGFGVVDPAREGQQTDSKLIYNGTVIGIPEVITITEWVDLQPVSADTTVENQVAEEYVEICHQSGNLVMNNVTFKNGLTIYTNVVNNTGTVTLENCTIYLNNGTGDPAHAGYTQYKADYGLNMNLVNDSEITFKFKNCTFTAADGHTYSDKSGYNVYIGGGYSAKSITFERCTFEKSAKHAIGCSSAADSNYYELKVSGCNFKDWSNNAENGAAIRGNLPAADFPANITISGNTFGNSNGSTQETVAIDSWNGTWN